MAMTTAEKTRISRQYDFLTDPDSAEQRQLVHNRLGLKPWEIAEAEAEYLRTTKQRDMSALTEQFGAPKDVTLGKEYTLPDMSRKTFSEGGDQRALELPPSFSNDYSPYDQKQIEGLYKTRSEYAMDRDLDEADRQRAFDKIDAEISKVPRLSPIMREPTAQQKFEASIVTDPITGQRGIIGKDGMIKPIIDPKIQQEENDAYNLRFFKNLDAIRKINNSGLTERPMGYETMDEPAMVEMARAQTDLEMGKTKGRRDTSMPEMDATWQNTMADMTIDNEFKAKKASEEQMLLAMDQYIQIAKGKKIREVDAKADFLQRWQSAIGGGTFQSLVPKMTVETQNMAKVVMADTVREDDPISQQYGLRRGESKVTVQNQELPPELDAVWGSLSNSDKKAVRKALASGANTMLPMENRMIKVEKGGEQFYVPILQIGEAKASGYTVVE